MPPKQRRDENAEALRKTPDEVAPSKTSKRKGKTAKKPPAVKGKGKAAEKPPEVKGKGNAAEKLPEVTLSKEAKGKGKAAEKLPELAPSKPPETHVGKGRVKTRCKLPLGAQRCLTHKKLMLGPPGGESSGTHSLQWQATVEMKPVDEMDATAESAVIDVQMAIDSLPPQNTIDAPPLEVVDAPPLEAVDAPPLEAVDAPP